MNCDEARATLLSGEEDEAASRHVAECAACRSRRDELSAGRRALAEASTWEEPSPELGDQVVTLIAGRTDKETGPNRLQRWIAPLAIAAVVMVVVGFASVARTASPDWEVPMPGTDIAPLATSTVAGWNEDAGTRIVVTIENLDRAPEGFFYEFWLSDGPLHISAGTFTAGGEIELWTGVSRRDFPRLWVTLEPIDEDEAPSEVTVLDTDA